jgi:hypothetical protein
MWWWARRCVLAVRYQHGMDHKALFLLPPRSRAKASVHDGEIGVVAAVQRHCLALSRHLKTKTP